MSRSRPVALPVTRAGQPPVVLLVERGERQLQVLAERLGPFAVVSV